MIQLPRSFFCGQLSRHLLKIGAHRSQHQSAAPEPPAMSSQPPLPPSHGKEFKEIQIPVPWGHISGKWWGRTDVQPVLMLHGWQDNAGTFDTLVPLLHNESLFAYDLVGHGQSSHYQPGQSYSYVDSVMNLRRIIKYMGWNKVSYIAHSLGSVVGYGYAAVFPEAVDKYVSIDDVRGMLELSGNLQSAEKDIPNVIDTEFAYEKKMSEQQSLPWYTYEEILDMYIQGSRGTITRDAAEYIVQRGTVKSPNGDLYRFSVDPRVKRVYLGNMRENNIYAMASQLSCHVLNLRATKSYTNDPKVLAIYESSLEIMKKCVSSFEYHVVQGTHHGFISHPEMIAPLINKFFKSTEECAIC